MIDWKTYNPEVVEEFRANAGRVERFGGLPMVILHTVGAKSGTVREVPLIVVEHEAELLLFGTAMGAPKHPDWVWNLRANPRIEVEYRTERFTADVVQLTGDEADAWIRRQSKIPQFADYQANAAPRVIPVFRIERVS